MILNERTMIRACQPNLQFAPNSTLRIDLTPAFTITVSKTNCDARQVVMERKKRGIEHRVKKQMSMLSYSSNSMFNVVCSMSKPPTTPSLRVGHSKEL